MKKNNLEKNILKKADFRLFNIYFKLIFFYNKEK